MGIFSEQEKQRLDNDLQELFSYASEMHRMQEIGDFGTVRDMLVFHISAIRDLAGRMDTELVEDEGEEEVCPRCGTPVDDDVTIADHGMCRDCFEQWQYAGDKEDV